jgi:hypothetical protein
MLLDDVPGCAGADTRGALAPICRGCARIGRPTRVSIRPAAHLVDDEWQCDERRSRGHVADGPPGTRGVEPLPVGGARRPVGGAA